MSVVGRYFLAVFLAGFAWMLVLVHLFVALASLVGFLARYPYLPMGTLLVRIPDLVLVQLPITVPFCVLLSGIVFTERIRGHRGFLSVQIAGADPRRRTIPILTVGAVLGLGLFWLNGSVLPKARYAARNLARAVPVDARSVALRLAEDPDLLDGYRVSFERAERGSLAGFALVAETGSTVVVADRAEVAFSPEANALSLALTDGRLLSLDAEGDVTWNFLFEGFRLAVDAAALGGRPKTEVLDLEYYTDRELDRLPAQVRTLFRHGIRPTPTQRRRAAAAGPMRQMRRQWAALPFLLLLLVVRFLGRHLPSRRGRRVLAVGAFGLLAVLPLTILLDLVAREGRLPNAAYAWLPTALVALSLLLPTLLRPLALRRRG